MRILVYAPIDLNLIDGSSVWCASCAQMLASQDDDRVDILLHAPIRRTVLSDPLVQHPRIRLWDPWNAVELHGPLAQLPRPAKPRLAPEEALRCIETLDAAHAYELVVVRGGAVGALVAAAPLLASRAWLYLTVHDASPERLDLLAGSLARIACQTPLIQEWFEARLGVGPGRYVPLPPMIPTLAAEGPRAAPAQRCAGYVGKFEADYRVEEMLALWPAIRAAEPAARLRFAGDKFHDPTRTGEFELRVRKGLQGTAGVEWTGAMPREEVGAWLAECDVGCCWRSPKYDDSRELSTKALEYGAAGLPVLLNPTRINRLTFGDDYPLYLDSAETFHAQLLRAWRDPAVYARAAERMHEVARRHTFAEVRAALTPYLARYDAIAHERPRARPVRVLFAGHDLKFAQRIMRHFQSHPRCLVRVDQWLGHAANHAESSLEALRWADAVWCEWCLGNAVWYSQRLRADQRLLIRFHRQELTLPYARRVTWPHVLELIFIAEHVRDQFLATCGVALPTPISIVPNIVECDRFDQPKRPGAEFTLGMLGYCPKLKNPQMALDILRGLRRTDARWRLVFCGQAPEKLGWLWNKPDERAYYEELRRSAAEPEVRAALSWLEWTDDPAGWYRDVGFILSCSDLEGSHQAVAEGMAAGSIPVVRRWAGAGAIYPEALLFDSVEEAVELIQTQAAAGTAADELRYRRAARARFDERVILPQLEARLLGGMIGPAQTPPGAADYAQASASAAALTGGATPSQRT